MRIQFVLFVIFFAFGPMACKKNDPLVLTEPALTTAPVSAVTQTTATGGGDVTSDGNSSTIERGVTWSTSPSPTISLTTKTSETPGKGPFTSLITGLSANTKYYVRAYASNLVGVAYGNEVNFTTLAQPPPVVTTTAITNITFGSASGGGNATAVGTAPVTARGIVWNTSASPTVVLSTKTSDGTGSGSFTSALTGLLPNTTYYVRAYATNAGGTGYGNQVSFMTAQLTDGSGNTYNAVTIGTQVWMKENLKATKYNDGTTIPLVTNTTSWNGLSTPGYCYYNNDNLVGQTYGGLYNWYAVNTGKLCPTGWHVPAQGELVTLADYLGGYSVAGSKLKETGTVHWTTNADATNSSGFTALPGGYRSNTGGPFLYLGSQNGLWTTTTNTSNTFEAGYGRIEGTRLDIPYNSKKLGYSVRCLMN